MQIDDGSLLNISSAVLLCFLPNSLNWTSGTALLYACSYNERTGALDQRLTQSEELIAPFQDPEGFQLDRTRTNYSVDMEEKWPSWAYSA